MSLLATHRALGKPLPGVSDASWTLNKHISVSMLCPEESGKMMGKAEGRVTPGGAGGLVVGCSERIVNST